MLAGKQNVSSKYSEKNKIELIRGGTQYFDLITDLIAKANHCIHLQTYIFEDDETGQLVANALKKAAKRNIQIYILVDGYASQNLSQKFMQELMEAGISFRLFEPIFKSSNHYFGRRLHHKIFVVDAKYALVGGINIANHYNDMPSIPAWLDFALFVEGDISKELSELCWETWKGFFPKIQTNPCQQELNLFEIKEEERNLVRIRRNDWVRRKNEISATFFEMFRHANSHIIIFCSYFLPGKKIRKLLKSAAIRGVKVRIMIAGKSDVVLAKYAEKWMYDWLLRNNIELFEYQSSILHAKVAVCDSEWLTIGSYNINNISAFASIELNLDVKNEAFAKMVENNFETIIKNDCVKITEEELKQSKNIFNQFLLWCSYQIFQLAFYLFTFYFKQHKKFGLSNQYKS